MSLPVPPRRQATDNLNRFLQNPINHSPPSVLQSSFFRRDPCPVNDFYKAPPNRSDSSTRTRSTGTLVAPRLGGRGSKTYIGIRLGTGAEEHPKRRKVAEYNGRQRTQ